MLCNGFVLSQMEDQGIGQDQRSSHAAMKLVNRKYKDFCIFRLRLVGSVSQPGLTVITCWCVIYQPGLTYFTFRGGL